jgi:hypothetical protein
MQTHESPFMPGSTGALAGSTGALDRWVELLRRVAEPVCLRSEPALPGGAGKPFALAVQGQSATAPQPLPRGDAGLWWAVVDRAARAQVDVLVDVSADGPLLAPDQFLAIEVWTESELCALHALFNLAQCEQREDWLRRVNRGRDWHLEHTQPDNATGRPWALHTFVHAGSPEAQHYAETLLHNAMAMTGEPDVTSAWILLDAARALEKLKT